MKVYQLLQDVYTVWLLYLKCFVCHESVILESNIHLLIEAQLTCYHIHLSVSFCHMHGLE